MSRLNQVIQLGECKSDIQYYIEDYAYTYLKKQKENIKQKYFLYGEKEKSDNTEKIYIYGVSEKPKLEQTYFKEYYPIGFLKIKDEKGYWISLKGEEKEITGCFIFYAPNQAMQEYLVDNMKKEEEIITEEKKKKQIENIKLPVREIVVPMKQQKKYKKEKEFQNQKFILPIGGIMIASLILFVLSSPNGKQKVEIYKQVMSDAISNMGMKIDEDMIME